MISLLSLSKSAELARTVKKKKKKEFNQYIIILISSHNNNNNNYIIVTDLHVCVSSCVCFVYVDQQMLHYNKRPH